MTNFGWGGAWDVPLYSSAFSSKFVNTSLLLSDNSHWTLYAVGIDVIVTVMIWLPSDSSLLSFNTMFGAPVKVKFVDKIALFTNR